MKAFTDDDKHFNNENYLSKKWENTSIEDIPNGCPFAVIVTKHPTSHGFNIGDKVIVYKSSNPFNVKIYILWDDKDKSTKRYLSPNQVSLLRHKKTIKIKLNF